MLFGNFGQVLNLVGPDDPAPQRPRRHLGDNIKVRHVVAALAVALLIVAGSWGVVIAIGWGVVSLLTG